MHLSCGSGEWIIKRGQKKDACGLFLFIPGCGHAKDGRGEEREPVAPLLQLLINGLPYKPRHGLWLRVLCVMMVLDVRLLQNSYLKTCFHLFGLPCTLTLPCKILSF